MIDRETNNRCGNQKPQKPHLYEKCTSIQTRIFLCTKYLILNLKMSIWM